MELDFTSMCNRVKNSRLFSVSYTTQKIYYRKGYNHKIPTATNESGPFPVLDNVLTSSQIIRLRLKAPGLLLMPSDEKPLKRDFEEDGSDQLAAKKIKISAAGYVLNLSFVFKHLPFIDVW